MELDVDRIPENESFFVHVMEAAERIRPGGVLAVRTDFEPSLLGAIMRGKDFESWSEERGPGEWRACFRRRRLP